MSDLFCEKAATLSPCGSYRYDLWRRWGDGPVAAFIMLNPSTADAEQDDPTIRRCLGFARSWGATQLVVGNLFALRGTDPAALAKHPDPVGPDNNLHIERICRAADKVVCAWGSHGALHHRGRRVLDLVRDQGCEPLALHFTTSGHPGHPLYLPKTAELRPVP